MVAVGVAFAWFGPQIREWFMPGDEDPGPTLTIGLDPTGLNDRSLDLYPPFDHSLSDRYMPPVSAPTFVDSTKEVRPAVVAIQGTKKRDGLKDVEKPAQAGVGIIFDQEGVIVTGRHVIEGLENIEVVLNDGRKFAADAVVSNRRSDVAIVTVQAANPLPRAHFGDSDEVNVGDGVLTLGPSFGYEISVTLGIVSATNRATKDGESLLQIDAAIGPSTPAGPVVNFYGEVIGWNLGARISSQGIGLAIPSNRLKEIVAELAERK